MADFPTSKKTWADLVDGVSPANSSDINSAYAEITAIEDAFLTDSTSLNASTDIHGFLPKLDGSTLKYLRGDGTYQAIPGALTSASGLVALAESSDVISGTTDTSSYLRMVSVDNLIALMNSATTDFDANTTTHGLLPKLDGTSDNYLNGKGEWWNVPVASSTVPGKVYLAATSDVLSGTSDQVRVITTDLLKQAMAVDSTDLDVSTASHGFMSKLNGTSDNYFNGKGEWVTITVSASTDFIEHNHSSSDTGGLIRLDTITAPTDSTSLDASTDMHGLLPKLSGSVDDYLKGTGVFGGLTVAASGVLGVITLAPTSDVSAGSTDITLTPKAITPDGLARSNYGIRFVYAPLNGSTALAAGDKAYFPIPAEMSGWNLVQARATCGANTSSDATVFTVKKGGGTQTLLSTNITIDPTLTDSLASSDQPVISSSDNPVTSTDIIEVAATSDCGAGMTYAGVLTGWKLP